MLVHGVDVQNCCQTDVRYDQLAIILDGVYKVLIEWLLLPQLHQVRHLLTGRNLRHLVAWLYHFFLKALNDSHYELGVRSKAEYHHVFVKVLDSQVLARFLLAPVFEKMSKQLIDFGLELLQVALVSNNRLRVIKFLAITICAEAIVIVLFDVVGNFMFHLNLFGIFLKFDVHQFFLSYFRV